MTGGQRAHPPPELLPMASVQIRSLSTRQDLPVSTQAVNCVSKLRVATDIAIKPIGELLGFFKEFRISTFENCRSTAKYVSASLESKFKDHCIQQEEYFHTKLQISQLLIRKII